MKRKALIAALLALTLTFGTALQAYAASSPSSKKNSGSSSSSSQTTEDKSSDTGSTSSGSSNQSSSGSSTGTPAQQQAAAAVGKTVEEYANNAVISVSGLPEQLPTAQGGGIIIDGTKSPARFELLKPTKTDVALGKQLLEAVLPGAKLISVFGTKSTVKDFNSAIVNYYIKGVKDAANVVCYELVGGAWVKVPVLQVYKDHVVVNQNAHGKLMFYELSAGTEAPAIGDTPATIATSDAATASLEDTKTTAPAADATAAPAGATTATSTGAATASLDSAATDAANPAQATNNAVADGEKKPR